MPRNETVDRHPRVWLAAVLAAAGAIQCGVSAPAADPDTRPLAADVAAAQRRLDALGAGATSTTAADGRLTGISIEDGSDIGPDDVALFGRLSDLQTLRILNCRALDDALVDRLLRLAGLESLALTNSGITDDGVAALVRAFPNLVELDLSSNTNLTGGSMKSIAGLGRLERLTLLQNRFNDLHTRRLAKMPRLATLDLRGNMEAGDMTLTMAGTLPHLESFKHRSSAVTDDGVRGLAASGSLESLLMQDFVITDASGPLLAKLAKLSSLEIFRCQGFGTAGVLGLAGLPLNRLTLRDLPAVGDAALAVLEKLPRLKRLYLHELTSVGDEGLRRLAAARDLEALDIWNVPRMTDATMDVIAGLPNLEELSIRETGVTEASVAKILALPKLESLTFRNNGPLSPENETKLRSRAWKKLDLGSAGGK